MNLFFLILTWGSLLNKAKQVKIIVKLEVEKVE